jgi:hypothetical protein
MAAIEDERIKIILFAISSFPLIWIIRFYISKMRE